MHQHHSVMPSRRSVVRAAAWTAPAISIAVAAPAFAASVTTPPLGLNAGSYRVAKDLYVQTSFDPGSQSVSGLTATVSVDRDSIKWITTPAGWAPPTISAGKRTATFAYIGTGAAPIPFAPQINLDSNPDAVVTVKVVFSVGAQQVAIPLAK